MWIRKSITLEEASREAGLEQKTILEFIHNEWITPAEPHPLSLDEEDVARARLIAHLKNEFGVNDEAVPIILHLLDQLHHLHFQLSTKKNT